MFELPHKNFISAQDPNCYKTEFIQTNNKSYRNYLYNSNFAHKKYIGEVELSMVCC